MNLSTKFFNALAVLCFAYSLQAQDLLISGVFDGPLTGGVPKALELYVVDDIPDLSIYGIGVANNGGGSDGLEYNFPTGAYTAGTYLYLTTDNAPFNIYFGFNADFEDNIININGDDAIELYEGSTVIDVYGDVALDGTGEPWEYMDGWAYRNDNTGPDGATFALGNWTISGPNEVNDCTDNATCASVFPIGTYTAGGGVPCDIIISEVMYNSASNEDDWEWIEVYNPCTTPIDLTGYVVDDNNSVAHSAANLAGVIIQPGESAIFYNATDVSAADFEAAWGTCMNLVATAEWNNMALGNGGDVIGIWSSFADYTGDNQDQNNVVFQLDYDDSAPWPVDDGAGSIYLTDLNADPTDGANWALSTDGAITPVNDAYTSTAAGGNSGSDIGSPCMTIGSITETCFEDAGFFQNFVTSNATGAGAGNLGEYNPTFENYQINGFVAGETGLFEVYLVSPELNYDGATVVDLNVDLFEDFDDNDIEVLWSVDFTGDPTTATWNNLTIFDGPDQGPTDFTSSETVDLTPVTDLSSFHVAFLYSADGSTEYSRWRFSNISVDSDMCGCVLQTASIANVSGCDDNGTGEDPADDFFTFDYELTFMDAPATGTLDVEIFAGGTPIYTTSVDVTTLTGNSFAEQDVNAFTASGDLVIEASFSEDPACIISADGFGVAPASCSVASCSQAFFSEYIEGTGNNKCLEIYNPTQTAIDMDAAGFEIEIYFNGNTNPGNTVDLSGTILPGDVFVVCSDGTDLFTDLADLLASGGFFNGDDAVVLRSDNGILDVIGQVGEDPGSQWGTGDVSTQNNTILKRLDVEMGDINPSDPYDPAIDWNGFPINFQDLGVHCGSCTAIEVTSYVATDETCEGDADGTITVAATSPGSLEYSFDGGATFGISNTATGLTAGCYTVVVQDPNSPACGATRDVVIENSNPSATLQIKELSFEKISTISLAGAEILAYDAETQRAFVTSGEGLQIVDLADPTNPTLLNTILPTSFGLTTDEISSVAVSNGLVAVAVPNDDTQAPGNILFLDTDGNSLGTAITGPLPDMITFTPDGNRVLTANEGEPNDDYTVDPQGTITIVDVTGGTIGAVTQVDFTAFNSQQAQLEADGVRIFGPGATVAQDLEPEYITVSEDNAIAYIALQENNAIATLDIASGTITDISSLGLKRYCEQGNALDASNDDGGINIRNWPVVGMYQPDGITNYTVDGVTYIITANEGDARDYDGFSEEVRIDDLDLDPNTFPDADMLQMDEMLGRLRTTTEDGDLDGDGDVDLLHAYGGRSFSIYTTDLTQVYDSGDDFERITAVQTPDFFNANDGDPGEFDNRSDDKGPEPEAVKIQEINGQTYAFIALERAGSGVMVYNITNPLAPYFIEYVPCLNADIAAEDLIIIAPEDNATGSFVMAVAFEESATVSFFEITDNKVNCSIAVAGNPQGGSGSFSAEDVAAVGGTAEASITFNEDEGEFEIFVGTGGSFEFEYTITDANGCATTFTQSLELADPTMCEDEIDITDPCVCLNNATENGNGQFGEVIQVTGAPGQIFTVIASNGLFVVDGDDTSAPAVPGEVYPLIPVTGAVLTEVSPGTYQLAGVHVDDIGYSVTVQSIFTGSTLSVSNECFYPDVLVGGLNNTLNTVCADAGTFNFSVATSEDGELEVTIDDVAEAGFPVAVTGGTQEDVSLDLNTLIPGNYTIEINFTPDAATVDAQNPGCGVSYSYTLQVGDPQSTLTCNDQVQVSLDENCQSEILPDMVLEGSYDGAFEIQINNIVDNTVDVLDIGENLTVKIIDLCGGNSCWAELIVEDKTAPQLACLDVAIVCTEDISEVNLPIAVDNCSSIVDVTLIDQALQDDAICDDNQVIYAQTYVAIDEYGNHSEPCTRTVVVARPTPDFVNFPDDVVWSCEQYAQYPYIVDASRISSNISSMFGGSVDLFDSTNAWDLTEVSDFFLTQNVAGTDPLRPTGSGIPTEIDGNFCQYGYTSADEVLSTCGFDASTDAPVFKILRTWTVVDWCTGQVVTTNMMGEDNIQTIKVLDVEAPQIAGTPITVSANIDGNYPQPCLSTGPVPTPTAIDNCSGVDDITAKIYNVNPDLNPGVTAIANVLANGTIDPALEIGNYFIVYSASDVCGNAAQSDPVTLTVVDDIAPTMVCDEVTQIALSQDGLAQVFAETFDDGTYDNCCFDRFEVRKMNDDCGILGNTTFDNDNDPQDSPSDPDNGEFVTFCCADIQFDADGEQIPVMVVLRAFDCNDNYNECMVEVLVEDKIQPQVVCPPNQTITCDEYKDDLQAALAACDDLTGSDLSNCRSAALTNNGFGTVAATDNCEVEIDTTVTINIDQCCTGNILRSFSVTDAAGNGPVACTQVVSITTVSDWVVEFPEDVEGFCDMSQPDFGEPEIFFETCELIATSFDDQIFNIVTDACFKITRQWTVINWCVVGDVIDQEPAAIELSEAELLSIIGFAASDLDGDGDRDDRTFRDSYRGILPTSDNDPDADTQDGFITYQQNIKIIDEDAPEIVAGFEIEPLCIIDGFDGTTNGTFDGCAFTGILPTPEYTDCILTVNGELDENGELIENEVIVTTQVFDEGGNLVSASNSLTDLPIGFYVARYTAIDRCGNTSADEFDFEVRDCKAPTAYCANGLVVSIMSINDPNNDEFFPMVGVWAEDLNAGSFDNCPGDLTFSFDSTQVEEEWVFVCDPSNPATPGDGGLGFNEVTVYVTDASGNVSSCETVIEIQDNQGVCDNGIPLVATGGNISTETNEIVEEVEVNINGGSISSTSMTDANGNYSFDVPAGGDYSIVPHKDINPLNGVTTFDLVKINKHILNDELLDSPYKMIAADANHSESITTLDIVHIRKLILLIEPTYTNNTSWRFVDADYVFPNPLNPWMEIFPEVININNLDEDALEENFVAVKIGDVTGNASGNDLLGSDDRSGEVITLTAKDEVIEPGQTTTLTVTAADVATYGMQFTLNFDETALELINVNYGIATAEHFGMTLLDEGVITFSWNKDYPVTLTENDVLFSIDFSGKADAKLSDLIAVNDRFTKAEGYTADETVTEIALVFESATTTDNFALYQNRPNPFRGTSIIGFNLPNATTATLTISDVSGKVIAVRTGDFAKGYNEIEVNDNDLSASGVLYYRLETAENAQTRKMVVLK